LYPSGLAARPVRALSSYAAPGAANSSACWARQNGHMKTLDALGKPLSWGAGMRITHERWAHLAQFSHRTTGEAWSVEPPQMQWFDSVDPSVVGVLTLDGPANGWIGDEDGNWVMSINDDA
jgi:hypothetical protein